MNRTLLMSGAQYFGDDLAINAHMDSSVPIDVTTAVSEHQSVKQALEKAGNKIILVDPPENCQDGVYTANWGLCRSNKAVLANLPPSRQSEIPYAEKILRDLGKEIIRVPEGRRFSGQGDALPCGNRLFIGQTYRTDQAVHQFLADTLGYEIIALETTPEMRENGQAAVNAVTGWPDSFFYDLDLALAVLRPDLIAWCPEAFMPESQEALRRLDIDKIEVSLDEAVAGFACNLVSNGETVVMSAHAPQLKAGIEAKGLKTLTPHVTELGKGGGYIRCITLTLD